MLKIRLLLVAFLTFILMSIYSCKEDNSVDSFLNNYEKIVLKWEEKAENGNLTFTDLSEIQKEMIKIADKEKSLKELKAGDLTVEQQEKLYNLITRLTKVTTKISNY